MTYQNLLNQLKDSYPKYTFELTSQENRDLVRVKTQELNKWLTILTFVHSDESYVLPGDIKLTTALLDTIVKINKTPINDRFDDKDLSFDYWKESLNETVKNFKRVGQGKLAKTQLKSIFDKYLSKYIDN